MNIKGDEVLFLLGAGASADAGIPISNKMVNDIESLIESHEEWKPFRELYFYLKSSINYGDGIFGKFNEPFNVERLLVVISEIEKRESNLMYPYIGTWNIRLLDLGGANFENLRKFHKLIRKQLIEWIGLRSYDAASYFESFSRLSTDIGQLIKVFTLNYDTCFENVVGREKVIELGFTKETKEWHYSNFDTSEGKSYNLYKLHGSIDWYIENDKLFKSDRPENNPELIFGIQHKMTSLDPYFYYSSILRQACFYDVKIIVVVGYSYADDYVNVILSQALNSKSELRILNIAPLFGSDQALQERHIVQRLNLRNERQLVFIDSFAKSFFQETLDKTFLESNLGDYEEVPFA